MTLPYSADGSTFDRKECRRSKGYQIGPKGAETWVDSYEDALRQLRDMRPKARWRRPSKATGKPGIVAAVEWK